jgi:hypothetical protein
VSDQNSGEPIADRAEPDSGASDASAQAAADAIRERRPVLERLGLAAIAIVMAVLFGVVAVAAFAGGEYFLAAMGFVGCMMTLAVGGSTLLRG